MCGAQLPAGLNHNNLFFTFIKKYYKSIHFLQPRNILLPWFVFSLAKPHTNSLLYFDAGTSSVFYLIFHCKHTRDTESQWFKQFNTTPIFLIYLQATVCRLCALRDPGQIYKIQQTTEFKVLSEEPHKGSPSNNSAQKEKEKNSPNKITATTNLSHCFISTSHQKLSRPSTHKLSTSSDGHLLAYWQQLQEWRCLPHYACECFQPCSFCLEVTFMQVLSRLSAESTDIALSC